MTSVNNISIVNAFNDCINNQDIEGLAELMDENHVFINRDGSHHGPKSFMKKGWKDFFKMFPVYRNTFTEIKAEADNVYVLGFAYWYEEEPEDHVIWTAKLKDGLIVEWRIYEDTTENRVKFKFR